MKWILAAILLATIAFILIYRARSRSITGRKTERKHFQKLSSALGLQLVSDDYFVQLEGDWKSFPVIVLPHHFEGPGAVTLLYLQTKVPAVEKNWIEPNLSLGRALVEFRRKSKFGFEVTGNILPSEKLLPEMQKLNYPYVALTLPTRFSYSPLLQKSLESWKNFVLLVVLDEGRKPDSARIVRALNDVEGIAKTFLRDT
jgi:hypothetical protein